MRLHITLKLHVLLGIVALLQRLAQMLHILCCHGGELSLQPSTLMQYVAELRIQP